MNGNTKEFLAKLANLMQEYSANFEIGETVVRHESEHDDLDLGSLGFIDETGSIWYMSPEEYEVL